MSRALEDRQGLLRGKAVPPVVAPVWNLEARMTMNSDMPAETCYHLMELLTDPLDVNGKHPVRKLSNAIKNPGVELAGSGAGLIYANRSVPSKSVQYHLGQIKQEPRQQPPSLWTLKPLWDEALILPSWPGQRNQTREK